MHDHLKRRFWLAGWIALMIMAAGCFQPAGGGLEATTILQAQPTFTLIPSETPSPIPLPTDTPTDLILMTEAPTLELLDAGTQIAMLQNDQLEPIWQTATAVYLLNLGQPVDVQPLDVATLDPLLQQATDMVRQATETAAAPATLTAQAIFGFPTATQIFLQPTFTLSGPFPQGADCVYEVQVGDPNLYRISLKFGVTYTDIAQATNMVNPNMIHVGDRLIIPGCGTTGYVPPPTSTPGAGGIPGVTPVPGGGSGTYVVQQGDTLFALSLQWGTTVNAIAALNGIQNVNLIYIDQVLTIP